MRLIYGSAVWPFRSLGRGERDSSACDKVDRFQSAPYMPSPPHAAKAKAGAPDMWQAVQTVHQGLYVVDCPVGSQVHEHRLETQPSINGFDVLLLLSYDCLQQQVSDSAATWMAPLVK